MKYLLHILLLVLTQTLYGQQVLTGTITGESSKPVSGASVRISNSIYATVSNEKGQFSLSLPGKEAYRLNVSHLSYQTYTKELRFTTSDTLTLNVHLMIRSNLLDSVAVFAAQKPETLVGKSNYSVFDFDFYEDKLLLLTTEQSLRKASIQLADYSGKILSTYQLPRGAGEAQRFFHDYEGYSDLICSDSIFRVDVFYNELLIHPVPVHEFNRYLLPVADTLNNHYYYTDRSEKYPQFNYYYVKKHDSLNHMLSTVTNADLMKLYNLEYYYLPSRMQLEARRLAEYYKTDVHIVAAQMSGFTQSMFYEPLYAPLFILRDTICIFNHHNDYLYHYTKQNTLIDSVKISYHHPKNWREWKKQLFVDESENKVYAFFSKNGHHYLKLINHLSGKEISTYKLKHHSAEKIKIRNGYVYYVYRPFGSTQERFLYRELIE